MVHYKYYHHKKNLAIVVDLKNLSINNYVCAQGKMYCKISLYGQLSKKKLCTYSVNNFDYVILYPFPSKFKYLKVLLI